MKRLLLVGVAMLVMLPMTAAARGRFGVFVGPNFVPYGYGWYGPWYGPYAGLYPYGPYWAAPNTGEVKLETKVKDAEVFINGSFAGTAGDLKTIRLRPGSYDIEVTAPERSTFKEKIFVVAGKTLKLHPDLEVETGHGAQG